MYERIGGLVVDVASLALESRVLDSSGWPRRTTVVHLRGASAVEGVGEDVTYEEPDQIAFQESGANLDVTGRCTLDEFSRRLDTVPLFSTPPVRTMNWLYRRWAFESAALDLALRQAETNLAEFLGLTPRPVTFVVSMNLGDPPDLNALWQVRDVYPDARFKVDLSPGWTEDTVGELDAFGGIVAVDLKGHYHGSFQGPPPNADQYRWVAEGLPEAWIEDPWWSGPAWDALADYRDRITWDANLHSVADIVQLPVPPKCVNIKPSRFGFTSELFRVLEYCQNQGIEMYGGGQFELGPGRGQLQCLASLFYPDTGNDIAPSGFNAAVLAADLPSSPLRPELDQTGFRWAGV